MGDNLTLGLIVFYLILASVFFYESNYPRVLYWICAAGITGSTLLMGK